MEQDGAVLVYHMNNARIPRYACTRDYLNSDSPRHLINTIRTLWTPQTLERVINLTKIFVYKTIQSFTI